MGEGGSRWRGREGEVREGSPGRGGRGGEVQGRGEGRGGPGQGGRGGETAWVGRKAEDISQARRSFKVGFVDWPSEGTRLEES